MSAGSLSAGAASSPPTHPPTLLELPARKLRAVSWVITHTCRAEQWRGQQPGYLRGQGTYRQLSVTGGMHVQLLAAASAAPGAVHPPARPPATHRVCGVEVEGLQHGIQVITLAPVDPAASQVRQNSSSSGRASMR